VIGRAGKPVARLVPLAAPEPSRRVLGAWRDRVRVAADFEDLPDPLAAAFRGDGS